MLEIAYLHKRKQAQRGVTVRFRWTWAEQGSNWWVSLCSPETVSLSSLEKPWTYKPFVSVFQRLGLPSWTSASNHPQHFLSIAYEIVPYKPQGQLYCQPKNKDRKLYVLVLITCLLGKLSKNTCLVNRITLPLSFNTDISNSYTVLWLLEWWFGASMCSGSFRSHWVRFDMR